ncbi:hypothetical protein K1719_010733 [Acacia pycnantha]|nr:hypothetical protein K1719_010733 [Acacia pycnantha]
MLLCRENSEEEFDLTHLLVTSANVVCVVQLSISHEVKKKSLAFYCGGNDVRIVLSNAALMNPHDYQFLLAVWTQRSEFDQRFCFFYFYQTYLLACLNCSMHQSMKAYICRLTMCTLYLAAFNMLNDSIVRRHFHAHV